MCTTVYRSVYISVVSFTVSPFIKPIKFSFWSCNQGQKTDIFLEQSSLPSLSQDQLNLPIDFFNTAAIHCLWHLAVRSLTPFNQINFIFLSMLCKRMSKNRRDLAWFKMLIFSVLFLVFIRLINVIHMLIYTSAKKKQEKHCKL